MKCLKTGSWQFHWPPDDPRGGVCCDTCGAFVPMDPYEKIYQDTSNSVREDAPWVRELGISTFTKRIREQLHLYAMLTERDDDAH